MRSRARIHGHPIHPTLIPFPFAYLSGAAGLDTAAPVADRPEWRATAGHLRTLCIATALLAAIPGAVAYLFAVPPHSSAARRATLHGLTNLAAVTIVAAVARRRRRDARPDAGDASLAVNQMALVHVGERRVVIARTETGWAAFDDRCTHRGGPLSDGALTCGRVQCPWHGSQFDVATGAVAHGPAESPVAVHAVEARGGRLWLTLRS